MAVLSLFYYSNFSIITIEDCLRKDPSPRTKPKPKGEQAYMKSTHPKGKVTPSNFGLTNRACGVSLEWK